MLEQGHTFAEIAQLRGRKVSSVVALVGDLLERGETQFQERWMSAERHQQIRAACQRLGLEMMKPVQEALAGQASPDEIRLVMAEMKREKKVAEG